MPLPIHEYEQARAGCVVFDQSDRGKVEATGSEARASSII